MKSAGAIRLQIEAALADRIPSALTPAARVIRPVAATGIRVVDELLDGGLPLGAITEVTGPECSGRSSLALSFLAQRTREGKVCAWIDVSDALRPDAAAAAGVDLSRLLWVRCGGVGPPPATPAKALFQLPKECLVAPPAKKGLYAGGWGAHPRSEVKGLPDAMARLLDAETRAPQRVEPTRLVSRERQAVQVPPPAGTAPGLDIRGLASQKPWTRLDQALRVTDLLLQAGGFGAVVLDMGGVPPEAGSRVPLATWFRYRAAAERSQASIILLTQHSCAKSSAGLVVRLTPSDAWHDEGTVFTGLRFDIEVERQRFAQTSNIVPLRKGPQRETGAQWSNRCSWAGRR